MLSTRITQLESVLIDSEVKSIFTDSLASILGTDIPEISLLIDFIYYRYTIAKNMPLPGQELQGIQFINKSMEPLNGRNKLLYLLIVVIGKYAHKRLQILLQNKPQWVQPNRILKVLEFLFHLCALMHFIRFLRNGKLIYSLDLVMIGFQLKQITPNMTRELDFELLNRTIIWDIINRLFQQTLTTSNYFINQMKSLFFVTSFLGSIQQQQNNEQCHVCASNVKTMEITVQPCKHSFCYYCLQQQLQSIPDKCPECKQIITLL